jgi:CRP/FNR family transcriptional regulator
MVRLERFSSELPALGEVFTRGSAHDAGTRQRRTTVTQQTSSKRDALAVVGAFGQLTRTQLDQIADLSDERHIPAGKNLCLQSDFGVDSFVIARGKVSVVIDGIEVAQRGAGDLVGDWALFGNGYRSATLRAASDVDVVVVDAREIDSLLMAVPSTACAVGPQAVQATH